MLWRRASVAARAGPGLARARTRACRSATGAGAVVAARPPGSESPSPLSAASPSRPRPLRPERLSESLPAARPFQVSVRSALPTPGRPRPPPGLFPRVQGSSLSRCTRLGPLASLGVLSSRHTAGVLGARALPSDSSDRERGRACAARRPSCVGGCTGPATPAVEARAPGPMLPSCAPSGSHWTGPPLQHAPAGLARFPCPACAFGCGPEMARPESFSTSGRAVGV
jgi:hypothetical protein